MSTNLEIYKTVEFNNFSSRENLLPEENILFERFLKKDLKTLEAGTAGGRILFELKGIGFEYLFGFDFVKTFIDEAIKRDVKNQILFTVQDASNLNYENDFFSQAIYLQQMISNITDQSSRMKSFQEAYRILKPGGTILFSFLSFESKKKSLISKIFFLYLSILRLVTKKKYSLQYLPWFKHAGSTNWSALSDKEPYNYWFKTEEIIDILNQVGFSIVGFGYPKQIIANNLFTTLNSFASSDGEGHMYFVCKKKG